MRFEAFVAMRYLRGKRKNRFVSLITIISVAGVSVGVMALIVVIGVMTGFDEELTATIMGNNAHLMVIDMFGEPIVDYDALIAELQSLCPEIVAASPYIQIKAGLRGSGGDVADFEPSYVIGIDPVNDSLVTQLSDNLTDKRGRRAGEGRLPDKGEIVLGWVLAQNVGTYMGESVGVVTLADTPSPLGRSGAQTKWLTVSGISEAQMQDFDAVYSYVTIETAQQIKRQNGVDGVRCLLANPFKAHETAARIQEELGLAATTWYDSNRPFFQALQQEKIAMFIILMFIVMVAAFNIASTLIMVVMEKKRDIGILRTFGTSSRSIITLFILEGLYIGVGGTALGIVGGLLFAQNLNPIANFVGWMIGVDLFNTVVYHFDSIPCSVVPRDVIGITVASIVLTFISTLYPAWNAARLDPVDALRYE